MQERQPGLLYVRARARGDVMRRCARGDGDARAESMYGYDDCCLLGDTRF